MAAEVQTVPDLIDLGAETGVESGDSMLPNTQDSSGSLFDDPGGPSSVEAQADPNDLEMGIDLDGDSIPEPTFPLANPISSSTKSKPTGETEDDEPPDLTYFDFLTGNNNNNNGPGEEEADVTSENAVPGVCGLRNVGNTCYMNSGLQCILATPPVVEFFLQFFSDKVSNKDVEQQDNKKRKEKLSVTFGPMLKSIWEGQYRVLRPGDFKEALGRRHCQFQGTLQHDCQEFLAILLDALHEELRVSHGGGYKSINR